jgi:heme/copper-type cytochrome/quinol oxidase subunit 4
MEHDTGDTSPPEHNPADSREPTIDELLALMAADEQAFWKSGDGSLKQREEFLEFFKARWRAAQEPTPQPEQQESKPDDDKPIYKVPHPQPTEEQLRRERINRAIQSGGRPDPEDLAEERAEEVRHQRAVVETTERKLRETRSDKKVAKKPAKKQASAGGKRAKKRPPRPASNNNPWHKRGDIILAIILTCLAGAMAIAIVLLPPTSTVTVTLWLSVMFILLGVAVFLIGHFFDWPRLKTIAALAVPLVTVLIFGWVAWPQPTSSQIAALPPVSSPTEAPTVLPTPQPRLTPTATPTLTTTPVAQPFVVPTSQPSPVRATMTELPPLSTSTPNPPVLFNRNIPLKGGTRQRLSDVLRAGGYTGPLLVEELTIRNPVTGTGDFYYGESDVNSENGNLLQPGDSHHMGGGGRQDSRDVNDTRQIYLFAPKEAVVGITLRSIPPQ